MDNCDTIGKTQNMKQTIKKNKKQQSYWARQQLYRSTCQQPKQYENTGQHSDGIMWTKSAYQATNSMQ